MHSFPLVLCRSRLLETTFRALHCMYWNVVSPLHRVRLSDYDLGILISVIFSVLRVQSRFCNGFNRGFMLTTCGLCKRFNCLTTFDFGFCMHSKTGFETNLKNLVRSLFRSFTARQHNHGADERSHNACDVATTNACACVYKVCCSLMDGICFATVCLCEYMKLS